MNARTNDQATDAAVVDGLAAVADAAVADAPAATVPLTGTTYVGTFTSGSITRRGGDAGKERPFELRATGVLHKYPTRAAAEADTTPKRDAASRIVTGGKSGNGAVYLRAEDVDAIQAEVKRLAAAAGVKPARIAAAMFASGMVSLPAGDGGGDITASDGFRELFGTDDDDDAADAAESGESASA